MKSDRAMQLQELADRLRLLISDASAENAVVPGNGYDESILVGSADSFLRLAKLLIEMVSMAGDRGAWTGDDLEEETIEGIPVVSSNRLKDAFFEFSPVWVMCAYLTTSDPAAVELTKKLAASIGVAIPSLAPDAQPDPDQK